MSAWDPTFMILPSMSCQAACKYCFGPHEGAMMDLRTARETVRFVRSAAKECGMTTLRVVFHGGEPLLAPLEVWETLLEGLSDPADGLRAQLSVQSNLWALDEARMALFKRWSVRLGTSLDGPKPLCDANRGTGYFEKTTAGMERAAAAGLRVGVIATLTKQTLPHAREILRYFRDRGLTPVLHAAIRGMDAASEDYALSPEEYAEGVLSLFPWYVENRKAIRVPTLDHFCAAAVRGESSVCTMSDCLGQFLVVTPTGDVTFCQRFAGRPAYVLGNIFDAPSVEELFSAPAAQRLLEREREVSARCGDCRWLNICRGGCWYNAISGGDGVIDPLCAAYKEIYAFLEERLGEEAISAENLAALRSRPARPGEHPLLRSGPYISLADSVHPSALAENARAALAAHELAKTGDVQRAAENLVAQKLCGDVPRTAAALRKMLPSLDRSREKLNNCYFHVTLRCNLRCTHCYASAGESESEMDVTVLAEYGGTASIKEDISYYSIAYGEDRAISDGDAVMEYLK